MSDVSMTKNHKIDVEISDALFISCGAVWSHTSRIYEKPVCTRGGNSMWPL